MEEAQELERGQQLKYEEDGRVTWKELVYNISSLAVEEQETARARASQSLGTRSEISANILLLLNDK